METLNQDRSQYRSSPSDKNNFDMGVNGCTDMDVVEEKSDDQPVIDIVINNVVCSFNVRCHLNLREIALNGTNVEYRRETGMLTMKLRRPYSTASMWSSGKITCTGSTSEEMSKLAARKYARQLQKLGFKTRFTNFRVVNVLGTCTMPFTIHVINFSQEHRKDASYEPELHPGVTYKIKDIRATLKIFSTGSITITAPSVCNVQAAVEHIFPLVHKHRKEISKKAANAVNGTLKHVIPRGNTCSDEDEEDDDDEGNLIIDSDQSWD